MEEPIKNYIGKIELGMVGLWRDVFGSETRRVCLGTSAPKDTPPSPTPGLKAGPQLALLTTFWDIILTASSLTFIEHLLCPRLCQA